MSAIEPLRQDDPAQVGAFRLVGRLSDNVFRGEGGAGEQVVVRLLQADLDTERFMSAIEPLRGTSAFCTAQILDSGQVDGRPYVVSEFIEGDTLQEAVEGGERLRGASLHRFAVGTMTALVAIHQAGVVHGDMRPRNVILGPDGPRVINFELAQAGTITASSPTRKVDVPAFTSPERLTGSAIEPPSDVFSWAATVAYAATGRSPFDGGSMSGTVNRIVNGEPELPDLGDLTELIVSCLAKEPADRPAASNVLLRLVGESTFLTGTFAPEMGQPPPPVGEPYPLPPPPGYEPSATAPAPTAPAAPARRGRPLLVGVAAFVAGALLAGTAVYALTGNRLIGTSPVAGDTPATPSAPPTLVTPQVTKAPIASVEEKAEKETKLDDIGAVLHEHSKDTVRLVSYVQAKRPFATMVRNRDGSYRRVSQTEQPMVSPDGRWVALNPWLKFQEGDTDYVSFLNLSSGERFKVTTVKRPEQTMFPTWSRDSKRLLLSVVDLKSERIGGFAIVDVAGRKASVVTTEFTNDSSLAFTFTPDGQVGRGYSNGGTIGIEYYNLAGRVTRTMHWVGQPRNTDWFSPSGEVFATVCPKGGDICVWDTATGARRATVPWDKEGRLLGWVNENHLLLQNEPKKKGGKGEVVIVDLAGDTRRLLAEVTPEAAALQFDRVVP